VVYIYVHTYIKNILRIYLTKNNMPPKRGRKSRSRRIRQRLAKFARKDLAHSSITRHSESEGDSDPQDSPRGEDVLHPNPSWNAPGRGFPPLQTQTMGWEGGQYRVPWTPLPMYYIPAGAYGGYPGQFHQERTGPRIQEDPDPKTQGASKKDSSVSLDIREGQEAPLIQEEQSKENKTRRISSKTKEDILRVINLKDREERDGLITQAKDDIGIPTNMANPVPSTEVLLEAYLSNEGKRIDRSIHKLQLEMWLLLQPTIRALESMRVSPSRQRKKVVELLAASIRTQCAIIADLTTQRRNNVVLHTKGYIDMQGIANRKFPAGAKTLFANCLTSQGVSFISTRVEGKHLQTALRQRGLSDKVIGTISKSRRDCTQIQYERVLNKYMAFCKAQGRSPYEEDLGLALDFLQMLLDEEIAPRHGKEKRGYSCMRIAVSALSTILVCDGVPFGQHHITKSFMKGVLKERPITHRYQTQWDPEMVLSKLKNPPYITADKMPLLLLAKKTLFLILMATCRRVHIAKALYINKEKCTIKKGSSVTFHIERKDLKQGDSMQDKPLPLVVKAFPMNRSIDPVLYVRTYMARTKQLRGDIKQLFITTKGPTRPISADTARNWVKDILKDCGVDLNQFGPGSTRGASTSKASALGASLEEILKAGQWSNKSVWQKYYKKPIVQSSKTVSDYIFEAE